MAQVETLERTRKLQRAGPLAAAIAEELPFARPNPAIAEPQHTLIAMQYTHPDTINSHLELDTYSNVPAELVLDAHFVDSALQAEVRHYEQELERMRQEQLEQLRRQQEAARQQAAAAATADSWQSPSSFAPASIGSSSSSSLSCQSSSIYDVHSALALPTFDQQSYLATGAAQTRWTYNNQPITTIAIACNTQFQSHEVTVIQRATLS